jgi:hypothetical protein
MRINEISPVDAVEAELAALEEACAQAAREMSGSHTVRETVELADVTVPHHLKSVARGKVHTLARLPRARDKRIEEVVKNQLDGLQRERSDFTASREFDRLRACDWSYLRSLNPELYVKAMREAQLIIERKQRAAR